jgi:hypothetical protein
MNAAEARERLTAGCWRWLEANVDQFFVRHDETGPARAVRLRAFGELLTFLSGTARLNVRGGAVATVGAAAQAWLPAFDWDSQLIRDPGFVVAVVTVVEFLEARGADATPFRRLVERALDQRLVDGLELHPYRRAELDRMLARAGFQRYDAASFARHVREAMRLLDKPPPSYTVNDYFALSHLVCYVWDDGRRDARELLGPDEIAQLRWLVATFGRIVMIDRDLDLAAEFLIGERFMGGFDDAFATAAVGAAIREQQPDGCIIAPDLGGTRSPFVRRYHSTLLWAYASELIRHGAAPLAA